MTLWRGLGATSYDSQVTSIANQYGIPPSLALAVMSAESSGNPNAVSSAGAQGLFQIMPANDASLGITNPFDPTQNITGGLQLLQQYYQQFGNWTQALEAYNQGPGSLNSALAAGSAPVSAGYASGILSAAGISDSSGSDSSIADPTTALSDGTDTLDLSSLTGLSGSTLALAVAILFGVAFVVTR